MREAHNYPRSSGRKLYSTLALAPELPRPPRARALRQVVRDYGSEVIWSFLALLLIAWMGLVALTLWH